MTSLIVQFVPQRGVSNYEIRARSSVKGAFTRSCNTQTRTCEVTGLPPGTDYTLWLQSCGMRTFKLCDLQAVEFQTYTPVQGNTKKMLTQLFVRSKVQDKRHFLLKGPTGLEVTILSETTLKVRFFAPTGNASGIVYKASTYGHSCEVIADAIKLTCLLTGLSNEEKYTVEAIGCEGSTKCSDPIRKIVYTTLAGW